MQGGEIAPNSPTTHERDARAPVERFRSSPLQTEIRPIATPSILSSHSSWPTVSTGSDAWRRGEAAPLPRCLPSTGRRGFRIRGADTPIVASR